MSYPLIIETLKELDLITSEQAQGKLDEYQRECDEYDANLNRFKEEWLARHAAKSRWKRLLSWFTMESWYRDWAKLPPEQKYPASWL